MIIRLPKSGLILASVITTIFSLSNAHAETVAAFYSSKSVTLIIPSGPAGGYDRYGRLVARHINKYIPGQPNILPQNMPGAGGVVAANYQFNVAPKDGSSISILQNIVPFKKLLDPRQVKYEVSGIRWLGSVSAAANIAIVPASDKDTALENLRERELLVGSSGGTTTDLPIALKSLLGLKLNSIKGYNSTNDILLAMERKEVSGMIGIDYSSFIGSTKGRSDAYRIIFQMGLSRHALLPNVPLVLDIARDDNERQVLEVLFASFGIGRSFATTDIPADRLAALRNAFIKTMKDTQFKAEADKLGLEVAPLSAEEIERIIASVYAKPTEVIEQARKLLSNFE